MKPGDFSFGLGAGGGATVKKEGWKPMVPSDVDMYLRFGVAKKVECGLKYYLIRGIQGDIKYQLGERPFKSIGFGASFCPDIDIGFDSKDIHKYVSFYSTFLLGGESFYYGLKNILFWDTKKDSTTTLYTMTGPLLGYNTTFAHKKWTFFVELNSYFTNLPDSYGGFGDITFGKFALIGAIAFQYNFWK